MKNKYTLQLMNQKPKKVNPKSFFSFESLKNSKICIKFALKCVILTKLNLLKIFTDKCIVQKSKISINQ